MAAFVMSACGAPALITLSDVCFHSTCIRYESFNTQRFLRLSPFREGRGDQSRYRVTDIEVVRSDTERTRNMRRETLCGRAVAARTRVRVSTARGDVRPVRVSTPRRPAPTFTPYEQ
ncbi:unnamed protein product, partial [Brenthis ino]